jgi:hypothetical protein
MGMKQNNTTNKGVKMVTVKIQGFAGRPKTKTFNNEVEAQRFIRTADCVKSGNSYFPTDSDSKVRCYVLEVA